MVKTWRNDRRSLPHTAGYLGGTVSPPAGPEQSPGGGPGAKPPEALKILHFAILKRGQKPTLRSVRQLLVYKATLN